MSMKLIATQAIKDGRIVMPLKANTKDQPRKGSSTKTFGRFPRRQQHRLSLDKHIVIDCQDAQVTALAHLLLPTNSTTMMHGRASNPDSHL